MYEQNLALNNLQRLICHKTQPHTKIRVDQKSLFFNQLTVRGKPLLSLYIHMYKLTYVIFQ